ncbi:hypothetical protein [Methylocella silvestris]|nr:hypothetical protein [Methylocella silvestris]
MRRALQPLSPQQLDHPPARHCAYLRATISSRNISRFDAAAREIEIIRRKAMAIPLADRPSVSAAGKIPMVSDHGANVEFGRANGRVGLQRPGGVAAAVLIKGFEGATLDPVEKRLINQFAAQYRGRQMGVDVLIEGHDEKHDHSLVGLDAHSIDLLSHTKEAARLDHIKGDAA